MSAEDAVKAALALHVKEDWRAYRPNPWTDTQPVARCDYCGENFPCSTVKVITATLATEAKGYGK